MSQTETLTTTRFRLLLAAKRDEWIAEHGHDHGWIKSIADRIGLDRSGVSAVWNGTKGAGVRSVEKAKRAYNLPPGFFFEEGFDAAGYLGSTESYVERDDVPPTDDVLAAFLADFGHRYSDQTIAVLKSGIYGRHGMKTQGEILDIANGLEKVSRGEAEIVVHPTKR